MGCDIHVVIERQEEDGWHEVVYQSAPYDSIGEKTLDGFSVAPQDFTSRNYDLFGILANVRNGSGFAGITTGEGWPSIAPERGLPEGFEAEAISPNPRYPEDGARYLGDHSHTWLTLDELKAFPWDGISTTLYGVVPAEEYERLHAAKEKPTQWSGGITGPGIATYDRPSYLEAKRMNSLAPKPYVRMSWEETARQATYDWPGKVIPWLEELAEGKPLRLIIGFDS